MTQTDSTPPTERPASTPRQLAPDPRSLPHDRDRAFIAGEPLRNVKRQGQQGVTLRVRLTSYRSLPLSCIEGIQLSIDGEAYDPESMILTLNGYSHKLADLAGLSKIFWFILDYAELFVPRAEPLAAGYHDVEGTLITVEPYATAGRFSHYNTSRKRLPVEAEQAQGGTP